LDILTQSTILAQSPTDISNVRSSYIYQGIQFDSPSISLLQNYVYTLKATATLVTMTQRYYQRPDLVAYDNYGSTTLWYIILYVNDCKSYADFIMNTFLVPDESVISEFISSTRGIKNNVVVIG
jgi:hypothetical protein